MAATIVYEWAGPLTYIRPRQTRGSAAGAHEGPQHRMAGRDARGRAVAGCGLTFGDERLTGRWNGLAPCVKCFPEGPGR